MISDFSHWTSTCFAVVGVLANNGSKSKIKNQKSKIESPKPKTQNPKSKIAFVANTAWNLHHFRTDWMRFFQKKGFEIVAIAPPDGNERAIQLAGFQFIPLKNLSQRGIAPLSDLLLFFELWKIYRREKPDWILHFTAKPNVFGSVAARLVGARSVATVTGLGYGFLHGGFLAFFSEMLLRIGFRFADRVVFQNRDDFQFFLKNTRTPILQNRGTTASQEKYHLVPGSGVDTNFFTPVPEDAENERVRRLLFVGRLLVDKGTREFLAAAEILKKRHPHLIFEVLGARDEGNPAVISEAEFEILKNSPAIRYLGSTTNPRPHLALADAVVLPSYREGMPRVILEAMSMGKPVVTTDAPGCRETVVEGKSGFLVQPRSVESLVEGIENLLALPPDERRRMGVFSRQLAVNQFDTTVVLEKYLRIIG